MLVRRTCVRPVKEGAPSSNPFCFCRMTLDADLMPSHPMRNDPVTDSPLLKVAVTDSSCSCISTSPHPSLTSMPSSSTRFLSSKLRLVRRMPVAGCRYLSAKVLGRLDCPRSSPDALASHRLVSGVDSALMASATPIMLKTLSLECQPLMTLDLAVWHKCLPIGHDHQ